MRRVLLVAALLLACVARADGTVLKPFQRGSVQAIVEARHGRPFILSFWSVDCAHCYRELEQLAALAKAYPQLDLVLVSTDTPASEKEITATLSRYALTHAERWVFADDFVERLRFEVDPRWHGELPRAYLYGPGKRIETLTGKPDPGRLTRWLRANGYGSD